MIDKDIKSHEQLENRIRFETLISDISSRIVRMPCSEIDHQIEIALRQIREFFDVERSGLLSVHENRPIVNVMYASYAENVDRVPQNINLADLFPWSYEKLIMQEEPVNVRSMSDLLPEADIDRRSWLMLNTKSNLAIPLFSIRGIRYILVIHSVYEECDWPDIFVQRLRLLGSIFVNALERRDTEYALKESEMRLDLAAASANAGLWTMDIDRQVFWMTEKNRELFDFPPDQEISVERFITVVHPNDRQRVRQTISKVSLPEQQIAAKYRIVHQDGSIHWIASHGHAHVDLNGQPNGFMGVSVDITEQKQTEEEMLRMCEQYTHIARVSAMGELTASLAHELKQPLAAIRSNAQAALRFLTCENPDIDELHEILKDIIADNRRADDIIGKLRAMMQKHKLEMSLLDMREVVNDVLPLVHSHELMKGIELTLKVDEKLMPVIGDRIQIQQVIINLILNSTQALEGMQDQLRSIILRVQQTDSNEIVLSVEDNGSGIEADDFMHLFEPFYTTKREGLGMGLAICRSIIDEHGGRLWAENNANGGATFYFTIPVAKSKTK